MRKCDSGYFNPRLRQCTSSVGDSKYWILVDPLSTAIFYFCNIGLWLVWKSSGKKDKKIHNIELAILKMSIIEIGGKKIVPGKRKEQ